MIIVGGNSVSGHANNVNIDRATKNLSKSLNRLSSGSRIEDASEDAGGLAVSLRIQSALNRTQAVSKKVQNGISFLHVQDGALETAGNILTRISELKTLSNDPTKNSRDVDTYNLEFLELQKQIAVISKEQFNGIDLFKDINDPNHELPVDTTECGTIQVGLDRNFLVGNVISKDGFLVSQGVVDSGATTFVPGTVETVSTRAGATGVDESGNKIAVGAVDQNWTVSGLLTEAIRVNPVDAWIGEPDSAAWIGSSMADTGSSIFSMEFDLSDFDVSTVKLTGMAATDDNGGSLQINGVDMGLSFGYREFRSFTLEGSEETILVDGVNEISGAFKKGINNFEVKANNAHGPHGLLFDQLEITAERVTPGSSSTATGSEELSAIDQFSIQDVDGMLQNIAEARAIVGSEMRRLQYSQQLLEENHVNLEAANSRIADVDISDESSNYARQNILVQSSVQLASDANNMSEIALSLITSNN
jgi:flagellin